MTFNLLDNIEIINSITFVVVGINLMLAAMVFSRGWRSPFNLLFTAISLSVAFWGAAIVGFYSRDSLININWIVWTHTFALLVSLFFLYFSIFFPARIIKRTSILVVPIIPVLIIIYFIFSGNSIVGEANGIEYEINTGYMFYSAVLLLYFFSTYAILILQYRRAGSAASRGQLKYIFIGYTVSSLLASFTDLTLPFFKIYEYTWMGPLFTLLLVASIFLSIVRHGLFNIRVLVAELFSLLILITLLFDIFISDTTGAILTKTFILIIVSFFIYQFIKGVYKEVTLRENLAKINVQLERLNLEKSEFLSLATHQLKAPLGVIRGYTSMFLEGSFGEVTTKGKETLGIILRSATNLVVIIDDFLNVSRIDQGRMKYDFGAVDVQKMITEVVTDLNHGAQDMDVDLTYEIKTASDYIISADIGKIRQVITNIIDNSIKYKIQGGRGFTKVILSKDVSKKLVLIQVTDNGMGMTRETIVKLFKRFSRAKDVSKSEKSGSGLGLYIARQMVEAHGGRIWVESPGEGKGSTFSVELPFTPPKGESLRKLNEEG